MPDIYADAKLFSALYVNTALLYIKRLCTESHSSLSNMIVEGVKRYSIKVTAATLLWLQHFGEHDGRKY